MSAELIAYLVTFIPAVLKFLQSQTRIATAAEHAIKQNSELLGRQTVILESVVSILNNLQERVTDLEGEEGAEVVVVGFRPEDEEEEEGEVEEEPVNRERRR